MSAPETPTLLDVSAVLLVGKSFSVTIVCCARDCLSIGCPLRSKVKHLKDNTSLPFLVGLAEKCLIYR
jgi:hypothetical protein